MTKNTGRPDLEILLLGMLEYLQALDLQRSLADEIAAGHQPDTLLLLEHQHCYTFGSRGDENNLLWDSSQLENKGISVHWSDRGGDVTYHGPGQLVGYPLLALGSVRQDGRLPKADYVGFLRKLEKTIIRALAAHGVVSGQIEDLTGVWVQPDFASRCPRCPPQARKRPAKIASIGVKVDAHGISQHGFSINVDPEMSYWEGIIACGLADYPAISISQLIDPAPSMEDMVLSVSQAFVEVFGYEAQRNAVLTHPQSLTGGDLDRKGNR